MPAPIGNQFWKARASSGRDPKFYSPEELWEDACEYFQWVENNPLIEGKAFSYEGHIVMASVPKMRAMTYEGFQVYLDMHHDTWAEYRKKEDFSAIVSKIDKIIRDQKFSGAAAGLLNANIIARDLGLSDKSELTGRDGGPIETKDVSEHERGARVAFALQQAAAKGTEAG